MTQPHDTIQAVSKTLIQMIQIEPGWQACFLVGWDDEAKTGTYGLRPIVCLGMVQSTDQYMRTDIAPRPFIMRTDGSVVCVDDMKTCRLVCVVGPDENPRMVVATVCKALFDGDWYEAQDQNLS